MVTPISSKSRIIFAHVVLNQAYPIISGQLGSCTMLNQNKFIRILLLLSQDKALFQWIRRDVRLQDQPTRDIKPWAGTRPGLGLAGPDSEVGLALIPELWKALKLFLESSEQLWIHWFGSGFFGHIPNPLFPCVCLSDGAAYLNTFCRGRYSNPRQKSCINKGHPTDWATTPQPFESCFNTGLTSTQDLMDLNYPVEDSNSKFHGLLQLYPSHFWEVLFAALNAQWWVIEKHYS